MKHIQFFSMALTIIVLACHSEISDKDKLVSFGIYEVVKIGDIPVSVLDTLQTMGISMESDTAASVIGYIPERDSLILPTDLTTEAFRLIRTSYTIGDSGQAQALVAIKSAPVIQNSDLKKTRSKGNNVELFFNQGGATKWAELTAKSIGRRLAFVVDDLIYTMPLVQAEIRNGAALINGLKDENQAKEMAAALNAGI